MTQPFFNKEYDQMPAREPGRKRTWWKWAIFAVVFALVFNGCVQNVQYEDNERITIEEEN